MEESKVTLNVGGHLFETSVGTLRTFPDSFLGRMFAPENRDFLKANNGCYFIDRDGKLFRFILELYRNNGISGITCCSPQTTLGVFEEFHPFPMAALRAELDFFSASIIRNNLRKHE